MKISIITLFPEMFEPVLNTSILKRAQEKRKVQFELINLREFGEGKHQVVDDRPYGGGSGLVFKPNILASAVKCALGIPKDQKFHLAKFQISNSKFSNNFKIKNLKFKIILMSASGTPYKQAKAQELSQLDHLILICGHYEGVDQRFIDKYVDEEISIGDYVLTGGEIPAMVIADSIVRLIPGVLEKSEATQEESFSYQQPETNNQLLEYPHYTRPEEFEGETVPEVLRSGNHQEIKKWREQKALEKTEKVRPDLLKRISLPTR